MTFVGISEVIFVVKVVVKVARIVAARIVVVDKAVGSNWSSVVVAHDRLRHLRIVLLPVPVPVLVRRLRFRLRRLLCQ